MNVFMFKVPPGLLSFYGKWFMVAIMKRQRKNDFTIEYHFQSKDKNTP